VRESYDLLYERESSVLSGLGQVSKKLSELAEMDQAWLETSEKVRELVFQLEEVAFQTRDYADSIHYDPKRLEQVEDRLAEIDKAKRKYGATIEEILRYCEQVEKEAEGLEQEENELEELLVRVGERENLFFSLARKLSEKRKKDAARLAAVIEAELDDLAMQQTRFEVKLERNEKLASEKGIDAAEFLISPNPGEPLRPLAKIVSGGELSRIMLALKSILKSDQPALTLVFDEIDAGIGGRVAKRLGEKLSRLSSQNQVFCVTHLPQIAALANQHFHVGKRTKSDRTIVELVSLNQQGRIEELSRMLAGDAITETTRRQAEELMNEVAG
jgi:DNA repair protein RecN (Recombination protein N)